MPHDAGCSCRCPCINTASFLAGPQRVFSGQLRRMVSRNILQPLLLLARARLPRLRLATPRATRERSDARPRGVGSRGEERDERAHVATQGSPFLVVRVTQSSLILRTASVMPVNYTCMLLILTL